MHQPVRVSVRSLNSQRRDVDTASSPGANALRLIRLTFYQIRRRSMLFLTLSHAPAMINIPPRDCSPPRRLVYASRFSRTVFLRFGNRCIHLRRRVDDCAVRNA